MSIYYSFSTYKIWIMKRFVWSMEVDQNEDKENIDEEVIEDAELIESIIAKNE